MQIHRFRGKTLFDALVRARESRGEDAVVVGHEATPDGGVTVAVADPEGLRVAEAVRAAERRPAAPAREAAKPAPAARPSEDPGVTDVRQRLARAGASPELVTRVARGVARSGARGAYAIDAAARILGKSFGIAPSPRFGRETPVIALVGPTGVGKTTTVAKLARKLTEKGRRVALATTDVSRPGATAELAGHAAELGLPVEVAHDARELLGVAARHRGADAILLDTAGRSPLDARSLSGLSRVLARAGEAMSVVTYLVLDATTQPECLDEVARGFFPCEPQGFVLTKLDQTRRPAPALEFTRFAGRDVAFLCDGQDVGGSLHRPRPSSFADLLLTGRLR